MGDKGLKIISRYISELSLKERDHLYRGHGDHEWRVVPSAFREGKHGIQSRDQLQRWKAVSSRFATPRPQSDLEWSVLAQHYGVPTMLLDWTTNPLVALFFACEIVEGKKAGLVLSYSKKSFKVLSKPENANPFRSDRRLPALVDTSFMNNRTLAQDSAMSIHSESCRELSVGKANRVFEIKHYEKGAVIKALRHFGMAADRLYSDINVAAREFSQQLEVDYLLS